MKRKLSKLALLLLVMLAVGCKTAKVKESYSTTDSTTVVYNRPVDIIIKGDTAKGKEDISEFNSKFNAAKPGEVLAEKQGNKVKYKVRKSDDNSFEIEAISEPIDTTVVLQEKHTTVTKTEKVVLEVKESWFERAMDIIVRYLVITGLILLAVIAVVLRLK
ncbi:putative membrane-anchored protein [Pontibacter aydingkolensis]|uniref:Lipoprotein n=1 Tax=Pontibacter aydingkolensis TaxID=1911536 RepID=A0ABS7CQT7_9BACT|nr:hypothetical protein [Pontibacter aydingkolensis]MBW7466211.1 hypothetical protein [Pontibacter aydingkolensis]